MERKKYFDELNIFRALVIFWIVVGHSTPISEPDYSVFNLPSFLFGYAYSFHMPAMFMLSGALFAGKFNRAKTMKDRVRTIAERFERLMVPYFFYTIISFVLKLFLDKYAHNSTTMDFNGFVKIVFGVANPNGGIWFLNALFFISVIAIFVNFIDIRITTVISIALFLFPKLVECKEIPFFPNFYILCENSPYFFIGLLLMSSGIYEKLSDRLQKTKHKALLSTAAVICLAGAMVLVGINLFIVNNTIFRYIMVFASTAAWYIAATAISVNSKAVKKLTMCIGSYGMDIYMLGYYVQTALRVVLFTMLGLNEHLVSAAMVLLAILLPIPASKYIIRRIKIANAIMLGDFKPLKRKIKKEDKNEKA